MKINQFTRNLSAVFAVCIGLYPLIYFMVDMHSRGLLQSKPQDLLNSALWSAAFFVHISTGGIALLTGWPQFNAKRRKRNLSLHRVLGRIYVAAVVVSSISGLYVAFFATGGWVCAYGFSTLALLWLFTAVMAYFTVRKGQIEAHRRWMILNYSLTFAAVTLRLWMPLFIGLLQIEFVQAYRIIAWLCWVPNLAAAWWISKRKYTIHGNLQVLS